MRSGSQVRISWSNEIDGEFPLVAVKSPTATGPATRPGRELGTTGYSIIDGVADLPAWTVVHLHGARTNAGNDGSPARSTWSTA